MVNEREKEVLEKYEDEGWVPIRGGAPDFLFLKVEDGKIEDFCFREVKSNGRVLNYNQEMYRKILEEKLSADYKVERVK